MLPSESSSCAQEQQIHQQNRISHINVKLFFSVNNQLNTDETECDDLKNLSYFFRLLLASSMIHSSVQTIFFLTVQMHGYNVKATQSNTSIVFHHMLHLKAT